MSSGFQPIPEAQLQRFTGIAQQLANGRPAFGSGERPARTRTGSGLEFKDFREYQAGDDSGRIDWRVSRRCGNTMIRQYHSELAASWLLCLDDSSSMSVPTSAKWGLAAQVLSAFAYLLLQGGHQVGLIRYGDRVDHYVPCAAGHAHYLRILQLLRGSPPHNTGTGSALRCIKSLTSHSQHIAVFSDCLVAPGLQGDLIALAQPGRQFRVAQVLSNHEAEIPGREVARLLDSESGATQHSLPSQEIEARIRLAELSRSLSEFCRRAGIPFTQSSTSHAWQQVVQQQYRACLDA